MSVAPIFSNIRQTAFSPSSTSFLFIFATLISNQIIAAAKITANVMMINSSMLFLNSKNVRGTPVTRFICNISPIGHMGGVVFLSDFACAGHIVFEKSA